MTDNQSIAGAAIFCLALAYPSTAWADPVGETCSALADARGALYSLLNAKDKSTQDALRAELRQASDKVDSLIGKMTGPNAATAADFKIVWDHFKATRDQEIIPMIEKGSLESAKKIADTIQLDRLSKMWGIMSCK